MTKQELMRRAIALAVENVKQGGGPFGAVIARNGEIVVALVEDSATVKRFYKENGHFRLQPENDDYEPIIVDSVEILGKVISVVRSYD